MSAISARVAHKFTTEVSARKRRIILRFDLVGNGILLPVVAGNHNLFFTLDSGASGTLIDSSKAVTLGLKTGGKGNITGAGAGWVPVEFISDIEFTLGELRLSCDQVKRVDLGPVQRDWGGRLDGIFGYDFLNTFRVTIDYVRRNLIVADFEAENDLGLPGRAFPIEFRGRHPYVTGNISIKGEKGTQSDFLIDTGSHDEVDHPLIASSTTGTHRVAVGVGLGRQIQGVFGRIQSLKLGTYEIIGAHGVAGDEKSLGSRLIGGGILRNFRVTFDYSKGVIFLAPTGQRWIGSTLVLS